MPVWAIVLLVIGYAFIATIIGTLLTKFFYKRGEGSIDASTLGWTCGIFWPISPIILACYAIHELLS